MEMSLFSWDNKEDEGDVHIVYLKKDEPSTFNGIKTMSPRSGIHIWHF